MRREAAKLQVVGCLPFDNATVAGFALPLLEHPDCGKLWLVQEVDELRNVVAGFRVIELGDQVSMAIRGGGFAAIGGALLHAFITEDGVPHVGTLEVLRPVLLGFARRKPNEHSIVLQIFELIGSVEQKREARACMRSTIKNSSGLAAARAFYEGSVLRAALWERILRDISDKEAAKRILSVRSRLSAHIDQQNAVKIDLRALDEADRALIDSQKIAADLTAEFSPENEHLVEPANTIAPGQPTERAARLLTQIRRSGRQEERIAILLDGILRDRESGMATLSQYQADRAKFANWAVKELKFKLANRGANLPSDEEIIAGLIPSFFTKTFPMSRGTLLLFLAKYLAHWPLINSAVRRSLAKSRSIYVDFSRPEIEQLLREGRNS